VLEVYSGDSEWEADAWEVLPLLGATLADALGRAARHEELREQADVDCTTGVYNHRYTQVYLERLTSSEAAEGGGPDGGFALLLLDLDHFTEFNECHGHAEGDRVLRLLADQLRLMTDRVGVVGRLGCDEFAVILPEHSRDDACAFAQAFEDWLDNSTLKAPASRAVPIGVSWGYASFPEDGATRRELLAAAERRLARNRRSGGRSAPDGDTIASAAG
jgi:diguanylate cyclase (GGDEF)-like protein